MSQLQPHHMHARYESRWLADLAGADSLQSLRALMQARLHDMDVGDLRSIAIVGSAVEGQRLARICASKEIEISAIVDDDPNKAGMAVAGRMVEPTDALTRLANDTPIVIASHRVLGAVQRLRNRGFKTVVPFALLQVLAPEVFPPHMFYNELLDDLWVHRCEYMALNDRLADEQSRRVLDAVLGFRQTLDPTVLQPVVSERDLYAPEGLFDFADDEVYVDGGSYDGDTIRSFIERVGGRYAGIYAFEPDPVTFEKLKANFRDEQRVHPVHAGLYSCRGSLRFRDDASRGAIFADDGDIEMPVTTIDDVLGDRRLTYVKMNIEGAEIDALHGSEKAIRKWLPRLAISVYHRASDLWRIPQLVLELSPDYDLYLRQHDGGIIETVLYALPRSHSARKSRA
jgi:FkbM family methyltransferase